MEASQRTHAVDISGETELKVGPRPDSRYVLESELGRGAMGVVFKARDRLIGRTVALKTIPIATNTLERNASAERLVLEAKAAGSLDHPNIITIYDVVLEGGFIYLSMQFVEGSTLAELLRNRSILGLTESLFYAEQICQALSFAHDRGVIHRDLKPSNLMLTLERKIKVLDFGIAQLRDCRSQDGAFIAGTPSYMAPEQASGGEVDHRSDIYSLGIVFYELFTGKRPFTGEVEEVLRKVVFEDPVPPSTHRASLPQGIEAVIMKALNKDPAQRFQDCAAMAAAFRKQAKLLAAAPQVHTMRTSSTDSRTGSTWQGRQPVPEQGTIYQAIQQKKSPRSSRYATLALAAAVILALTVAGWALWRHTKTTSLSAGTRIAVNAPKPVDPLEQQLTAIRNLPTPEEHTEPLTDDLLAGVARHPGAVINGSMVVTSVPPGASVEIEGSSDDGGQTPFTAEALKPGPYKVVVRKPGYAVKTVSVQIPSGKRAEIAVKLMPVQGFLSITSSPPGAHIWLSGKDTGKVTPAQLLVDPGELSISLHGEDYLDESTSLQITAGASANYAPTLRLAGRTDNIKTVGGLSKMFGGRPAHDMAQIEIKTEPKGVRILINGKLLEKTTPAVIQVDSGNYDIVLEKDGFQSVSKSVIAGSKDKIKLKEALSKSE